MSRALTRRGAHIVEFALILPVWLAIVGAIIDFGHLFFHRAMLDAAANVGCRAGSLVDPGDRDERIDAVEDRTTARMVRVIAHLTGVETCEDCAAEAWTVGRPPARSLVCRASRTHRPILGLYFGERTLTSMQVARLEWQREAAPE